MMMIAMVSRANQMSAMILNKVEPPDSVDDGTVPFHGDPGGPAGPMGPAGPPSPLGPVLPVGPAGPDGPVWPVAPTGGASCGMADSGHGTQSLLSFTY